MAAYCGFRRGLWLATAVRTGCLGSLPRQHSTFRDLGLEEFPRQKIRPSTRQYAQSVSAQSASIRRHPPPIEKAHNTRLIVGWC